MPNKMPVFRIGDQVRITDPRRIVSVGYDTNIDTMIDKASRDERVIAFCKELRLYPKYTDKIIRIVARYFLMGSLKSGAKRKITFAEPEPDLTRRAYYIVSKHVRYTGAYGAASESTDYWGEYDYDPACLIHPRAYIILQLSEYEHGLFWSTSGDSKQYEYQNGLFVTTAQVEKVTEDK